MKKEATDRLKRPRYPMPGSIHEALVGRGLMSAYTSRPPYQQNDYLGWITRAKLLVTREKRLLQMLDELEQGDVYMKMVYRPKRTVMNEEGKKGNGTGRKKTQRTLLQSMRKD